MEEQVRIICVDDETNVLKALQRIFLDDDYEILTATSGDEGLEILKRTDPVQIVISDYRMPGLNGVDFLKEVYRHWPETVRIVLSGYADTAAVVSAINEGHIYKFIPKPWNDDELKVTVANAIERYFLHKKNLQLMENLAETNEELQVMNETLETLVSERTSELTFQNRALTYSQNILDSLPVAVVGLDTNGQVVQCNRQGVSLFGVSETGVIGTDRQTLLPDEANRFVEEIMKKGDLSRRIQIYGFEVKARGVFMKQDGQEGVVLMLDSGE
ncbi:MAG: two-component system NtrC family sensor [Geobacteraceae bacterium]|nr:MAG: two-component system NtrC family sensor [Geobacteraceae bacterium]